MKSKPTWAANNPEGEAPMKKALNIIAIIVVFAFTAAAQSAKLTSKMVYHGGPVLPGTQNI